MKCSITIWAAVAISFTSVAANPITISQRAVDPQHSSLLACIQQKHPNFPTEGKPTPQEMRNCLDEAKTKTKRDIEAVSPATGGEEEDNIK